MTDLYAVIGNPIAHSKSPIIHQAFAKQLKQDIDYSARLIELDNLAAGIQQLQAEGFKGINVTVPFKEQVWQLIEHKSIRANLAGAVNTVVFHPDGQRYGDNTDGIGLCRDLIDNNQITLSQRRILLLGAGGAAKGVVQPLLDHQPTELVIANRTVSKAEELAKTFAEYGTVNASSFEDIKGEYDLIINATSASLHGEVPPIASSVLSVNSSCYDMMYGTSDTAFIQWAKARGVTKTMDGLGMLVEQAAEAFRIWRGIKPQTQSIIKQLR